MRSSKLIETLKKLEKTQFQSFADFLNAPYFNKSEKIIQLYDFIRTFSPEFSSNRLTKENAFSKVYANEHFQEKKIYNLVNQLMVLLEEFIIAETIKKDVSKRLQYLLDYYIKLDQEKNYKHTLKKYTGRLNAFSGNSNEFYKEKYQLNYLELQYAAVTQSRAFNKSLQNVTDNFDTYYFVEKLRLSAEMLSRQRIVASDYSINFLQEVKQYIQSSSLKDVPAIKIYLTIIFMLENEEDEHHFNKLKELLEIETKKFSNEEARQMYFYAVNYCIRKFNQGSLKFLNELFELNKILLDKKLLLVNDVLSPWRFKNIVAVGIKTSNIKWTEKFLHEYESYLPGDVRDVMLAYNKALLWHAKGDYAKSMKALQSVETDDVFMTIDSKSLLIKIYYEQNENEALLNLMDSFRIFIQRNKIISTYHKNVRLNFIKFIRKLIKLPLGNKQYLLEIQDQIKKSSEVESKDWILKMIELKLN